MFVALKFSYDLIKKIAYIADNKDYVTFYR